jgi:hypothetical protein
VPSATVDATATEDGAPSPTATLGPTATRVGTPAEATAEVTAEVDALTDVFTENLTLLREAISDENDYQCEMFNAIYLHVEERIANEDDLEIYADYETYGDFVLSSMDDIYDRFCLDEAANGVRLPNSLEDESDDLDDLLRQLIGALEPPAED